MAVRCLGMFCGAYEMYQNKNICYKAYKNIHTSVKYIIPKTSRQNNKILSFQRGYEPRAEIQ